MVYGPTMYDLLMEHKEFTGEGICEVARRCGISRNTLSNIATLRKSTRLDTAARISEVLGVSLDALYQSLQNERMASGVGAI